MPNKLRDITFKVIVCQNATDDISVAETAIEEALKEAGYDAVVKFQDYEEYDEAEDDDEHGT